MSRSIRQDVIKQGSFSRPYWRKVRRVQKNNISKIPKNIDVSYLETDDGLKDELNIDIKSNKVIVNDYDYNDYIFRDCGIKHTRK